MNVNADKGSKNTIIEHVFVVFPHCNRGAAVVNMRVSVCECVCLCVSFKQLPLYVDSFL